MVSSETNETPEEKKSRLEAEKLQLEINELKQPYWLRVLANPQSILQFVTAFVAAAGAIAGAYLLVRNNLFDLQKQQQTAELNAAKSEAATSRLQAATEALNAKQVSDDAEAKTKAATIAAKRVAEDTATAQKAKEASTKLIAQAKRDSIEARADIDSLTSALDAETILSNVGNKHPPDKFPAQDLDHARSLAGDAWKKRDTPQARDAIARAYSLPTDMLDMDDIGVDTTGAQFSSDETYLIQTTSVPENFNVSGIYVRPTVNGKFARGPKNQLLNSTLKIEANAAPRNPRARISPDDRYVAAIFSDSKVRIWEKGSGQPPYPGEPRVFDAVSSILTFSKNGSLAFFQSGLKLRIWKPDDPGRLVALEECQGRAPASSFQFSPDGHLLAIGDIGGEVHFCDARTGKEVRKPIDLYAQIKEPHGTAGLTLDYSHDGTKLLIKEEASGAALWDATTSSEICPLDLKQNGDGIYFSKAIFSQDPKSKYIFTITRGLHNSWVTAWTGDGCKFVKILEPDWAADIQLSTDGHRVLIGAKTSMEIWDATTLEELSTLHYECDISATTFSPKGDYVVAWTACVDRRSQIPILSIYTVVPKNNYDQISR